MGRQTLGTSALPWFLASVEFVGCRVGRETEEGPPQAPRVEGPKLSLGETEAMRARALEQQRGEAQRPPSGVGTEHAHAREPPGVGSSAGSAASLGKNS